MPSDIINSLPTFIERDSMVLLPLTISKSTFEFVSWVLKLPKVYLPSLERRTPIFERFNPDNEDLGAKSGPGSFVRHSGVSS